MKQRILAILTLLALLVGFFAPAVQAVEQSWSWEGWTPISTQAELRAIENDMSGKYYLTNNITLTGNWEPLGAANYENFTGILDGNGYTISNLKLVKHENSSAIGLFGGCSGSVHNLSVALNTSLTFSDTNWGTVAIGGIAGSVTAGGIIYNCHSSGTITITMTAKDVSVGGIAGTAYSSYSNSAFIKHCTNTATITATDTYSGTESNQIAMGGIVGKNTSNIYNCRNEGDLTAHSTFVYLGGVAGYTETTNMGGSIDWGGNTGDLSGSCQLEEEYSEIYVGGVAGDAIKNSSASASLGLEKCYNTGSVTASGTYYIYAGGIAGNSQILIDESYNAGAVTAIHRAKYTTDDYAELLVGGIVGNFLWSDGRSITDCYNTGTVSYQPYNGLYAYRHYTPVIGGIAGRAQNNTFTNCFNIGTISKGSSYTYWTGGILGHNWGNCTFNNVYWNKTGYAQAVYQNPSGTTPDTTGAVTGLSYFANQDLYTGFNFNSVWTMGTNHATLRQAAPHKHSIYTKSFVQPTCTATGMLPYGRCDLCGTDFRDTTGTYTVSRACLVIDKIDHAWTQYDCATVCTTCGNTQGTVSQSAHSNIDGVCPVCGGIPVNQVNFPDAKFRSYILSQTYGTDSLLTEPELKKVSYLSLNNKGIQNLKGIEFFSSIGSLYCSSNQLTSLDVSRNPELYYLDCSSNQITQLLLCQNTRYEYFSEIICANNRLTSLDAGSQYISSLDCSGNGTTIQVGSNRRFDLTQLPGFDVSKASNWSGGTVEGTVLNATSDTVTYTYNVNGQLTGTFTLTVEQVCDHTWQDATCTESQICTLCGVTEGDPLGHSFTNYTSNNNASALSDETETAQCDRCHETDTRTVPGTKFKPTQITITQLPENLSYQTGQEIDLSGLVFTATYDQCDPVVFDMDAVECVDVNMETAGKQNAVITYMGCTASFTVYIHESGEIMVPASEYPESSHNYGNSMDETKTFTWEGAQKLIVTFGMSTEVENNYDRIDLLDGNGNQLAQYTGTAAAGKTVTIPGDTFKIRLTSDGSVVRYGYSFSSIVADMGMIHPPVIDAATVTCTQAGLTEGSHCEICGITLVTQHEAEALGHDMGEWITVKSPTCTEAGEQARSCLREGCNHTETETIEATGHTEVTDEAMDATCEEDGLTEGKHCSVCNEVLIAQEVVSAKGHSYGEWTETKAPTCTEAGEETRMCSCGETETKEIAETNHSYEFVIKEPTCKDQGYTTYTCSACGDSYVDTYVDALDHKWDAGVITKEPTEEEFGTKLYTCERCGEPKEEIIPKLEHVHVYTSVATDPTCTEEGYTTHTCKCGDSYVDTYVDALDHKWDAGVITKEPTEEEFGTKFYTCERCGEPKEEIIPKLEHVHVYTSVVTEPTYTEKGYTTHTCTACGNSYVDTYVDPLPIPTNANVELSRMVLGNELAMQFAFKAAPIVDGVDYVVAVTKTYADGKESKVVKIPESQWKPTSAGGQPYYYIAFNGISAMEMGDEIHVQILTADGTPVGGVFTDSIRSYAVRQLRKTTNGPTRTLYVDMLNYGAAAQKYFNYDAEDLVNGDLTETEKSYGTKSLNLENNRVPGPNYVASQLNLVNSIQLRLKFNNINSSMYAIVEFTDYIGRPVTDRVEGSEFLGDGTVVVVDQVVAADYDSDVTVTIYDANDNTVASVVESVASYIARMSNGNAIYDAVAKYCAAAYAYLNK